ncbi:hypothetical protein [Leptospira levettii]|uniref:hypothetical protein n=1 Tax=Leptospira levettii TaxID=2023178 RepID=UPI000F62E538|nr:hypothetical protein [Leptospira levettii]
MNHTENRICFQCETQFDGSKGCGVGIAEGYNGTIQNEYCGEGTTLRQNFVAICRGCVQKAFPELKSLLNVEEEGGIEIKISDRYKKFLPEFSFNMAKPSLKHSWGMVLNKEQFNTIIETYLLYKRTFLDPVQFVQHMNTWVRKYIAREYAEMNIELRNDFAKIEQAEVYRLILIELSE